MENKLLQTIWSNSFNSGKITFSQKMQTRHAYFSGDTMRLDIYLE